MSCGCDPGQAPTIQIFSDVSTTFTIGDPSRTWSAGWVQAGFPNPPCTSPHMVGHYYWQSGMAKYAIIGGATPVQLVTGTTPASTGPFPSLNVVTFTFTTVGVYRLRVDRPVCGTNFFTAYLEVTVSAAPSTGGSKMLVTGASML